MLEQPILPAPEVFSLNFPSSHPFETAAFERFTLLASNGIIIGQPRGSGTFGQFFSGFNLITGEPVGIKEVTEFKQSEAQTSWEVFALEQFSGHPNFLTFIQYIKGKNGLSYILTELADMDLGFVRSIVGPFPMSIVAYLGMQVSLPQLPL